MSSTVIQEYVHAPSRTRLRLVAVYDGDEPSAYSFDRITGEGADEQISRQALPHTLNNYIHLAEEFKRQVSAYL
ncbi:hypothetical protein FQZ97_510350 [compost metagenome]